MRTFHGYTRTVCDCDLCKENCRVIPGYLQPQDIHRMQTLLGYFNTLDFAMDYLLASAGAIVRKGDKVFRVRTLVPGRQENGSCVFFDGIGCEIHEAAPFGCAFFDAHDTNHDLAAKGLINLMKQPKDSLYYLVWDILASNGHVAFPPEKARKRFSQSCLRDTCEPLYYYSKGT